ncbi:hypothetical protein SPURM210S_06631 [Streptomyces purpurascens]
MASWTAARVRSETCSKLLITLETVLGETPAYSATSLILGLAATLSRPSDCQNVPTPLLGSSGGFTSM